MILFLIITPIALENKKLCKYPRIYIRISSVVLRVTFPIVKRMSQILLLILSKFNLEAIPKGHLILSSKEPGQKYVGISFIKTSTYEKIQTLKLFKNET